jgi:hypothetical protein
VPSAHVTHPVRKAQWGISLKEERKGIFNALLYKKFPDLYRKKIQPRPPLLYYGVLGFFICFLAGVIAQNVYTTTIGICGWVILTTWFILKRLKSTSQKISHVLEMVVTSIAIPFLSIFWRWYGVIKFKTLMI